MKTVSRRRPSAARVRLWREQVKLPTYLPAAPDKNPMFLQKRVYQGSSGCVYPLPFIDRIAESSTDHAWDAVFLENEFLLVMLLPQLGGRIHRILDKTNGYDAIYYQPVIKPALVGLAGPWASGGIEFNWPQHHRPSTFMPTDVAFEPHADGSATVWLSEHDPMARMKGMHGVCLYPGRSVMELKVRVYNRTADTQTFLWWANAATRVHEHYQSFFPPDVSLIADHARRAMAAYPRIEGRYYGVDYGARRRTGVPAAERPRQYPPRPDCAPDDVSWYANIPVPTSYMAMGSRQDFVGGYDHRVSAGLMHVADHRIAPGKKQWTWGNHEFGYAWDRNLTDPDENGEYRPYVELMAGVFTDNQPDFSFIGPGETRAWSQYWYPYRDIGIARQANRACALNLDVVADEARLGVAVTSVQPGTRIRLEHRGRKLAEFRRDLDPGRPFVGRIALPRRTRKEDLRLLVTDRHGAELGAYAPQIVRRRTRRELAELAATEPPAPDSVATVDELYLTGVHLEQYRHATRLPEPYWREALKRDPGDSRCHVALGRWHLRRGEFTAARRHLQAALRRLTRRNSNPPDGEASYRLGICLGHQALAEPTEAARLAQQEAARDALAKAAWDQAWQPAAHQALAEIACHRRDWPDALAEIDRSLRGAGENLRARNLKVLVLRRLERAAEAEDLLRDTMRLDPLDWWSRDLAGEPLACATQVRFDLALDYARAGFFREALKVLAGATPESASGTAPMLSYYRAWLSRRLGDPAGARRHQRAARRASPDYCFPSRLEEMAILQESLAAEPGDGRAAFFLGNLLYDRRRQREAIGWWQTAVRLEPANAVAWRNLGVGAFNILRRPGLAWRAYGRARAANPGDARLLYEQDQLAKRLGRSPRERLRCLEAQPALVRRRDDLTVELSALYNQTGQPEKALAAIGARKFQPWEGGEGQALAQHVRTHLQLGRKALAQGEAATARSQFECALNPPPNLGEARHPLANQSDIRFWLGEACAAAGDRAAARQQWRAAATFRGDFQEMSVRVFSEMTFYSARAWERLGEATRAQRLWRGLLAHARALARTEAKIDYFATSLPALLLFEDDLSACRQTQSLFLEAQAQAGLGRPAVARRLLRRVLRRDPNHPLAADFLERSI